MPEMLNKNNTNNLDNEIDLVEFLNVLWNGKLFIVFFICLSSLVGFTYSLFLPNIYESRASLNPVNASNGISKSLQNYAGLAGIAGVNFNTEVDVGNSKIAIQKLGSFSFFKSSILPNINLPDLMAVKSWDSKTNSLNYDKNIYNEDSNIWASSSSYSQNKKPSPQQSYKVFKTEHFSLSEDSNTGFISLKIKHQSPFVAKEWAELMIREINNFYRKKDKLASEQAVKYLNEKIAVTNLSEVKEAISQILQDETRKLALIEAQEYYVFDYIDNPVVMEEESEPRRPLIFILSAFIGAIFSIIYVLTKYYFIDKKPFHKLS